MIKRLAWTQLLVALFIVFGVVLGSGNAYSSMINLASGCSYTVDNNANYPLTPDANHTKLTDGLYAENWFNPNMVGWMYLPSVTVIFDLGSVQNFDRIVVPCVGGGAAGVYFPAHIDYFVSSDGSTWSPVDRATDTGLTQGGNTYTVNYTADDLWATGRYIRLVIYPHNDGYDFLFFPEVEILQNSEYTSNDRASHQMKYFGDWTNLSQGRSYTHGEEPNYSTTCSDPDRTKLTDGENATIWFDSNMVGWKYMPKAAVTIDLGSVQNFDRIEIPCIGGGGAGVYFPERIEYYVSTDGLAWSPLDRSTDTGLTQNGSSNYTVNYTADNLWATGRYVKMLIYPHYDGYNFIFTPEVKVLRNGMYLASDRQSATMKYYAGLSNLAQGRPYTLSPAANYYTFGEPDPQGTKLTDGLYALNYADYTKSVGWSDISEVAAEVDLGQVRSIDKIRLTAYCTDTVGIDFPATIDFYTSTTGAYYYHVASISSNSLKQFGQYYPYMFEASDLWGSGRYVKAVMRPNFSTDLGNYLFLSELEVIQDTTLDTQRASHSRRIVYDGQFTAQDLAQDYVVYVKPPFVPVAADYIPAASEKVNTVTIQASPDEYEPATFHIYPMKNITGLTVSATNLVCGGNVIPASNIDLQILSRWNQGSSYRPVSELLVRDDSILSSLSGTFPAVTVPSAINTNLTANSAKQIWATVYVPSGTPAGTYQSTLTISASNVATQYVTLNVVVRPIQLAQTGKLYGGYFCWCPPYFNTLGLSGDSVFTATLQNMKKHGLNFITLYQWHGPKSGGTYDLSDLAHTLDLYAQQGMEDTILYLGTHLYSKDVTVVDPDLVAQVNTMVANNPGFPQFAWYGIDEVQPADFELAATQFETVQNAGGITTITCNNASPSPIQYLGSLLDIPIIYAGPRLVSYVNNNEAASHSKSLFYYYSWYEDQRVNRLAAGFFLEKTGLDGICPWAYSYYNAYDEMTGAGRYTGMAYPTSTGEINTVEYEAYREGVDDMRYIATLRNLIALCNASSYQNIRDAGAQAQTMLDGIMANIDLNIGRNLHGTGSYTNLQTYRQQIADEIQTLAALNP